MLTPQETENLYRLLTSRDIKNITLGLEIAKAHGWDIDKVAKTLEKLFLIPDDWEESEEFIERMLDNFEMVELEESIKMVAVGYPDENLEISLEEILLNMPNLVYFLPWQGKINAHFKIHYICIEKDKQDAFEEVEEGKSLKAAWKLFVNTFESRYFVEITGQEIENSQAFHPENIFKTYKENGYQFIVGGDWKQEMWEDDLIEAIALFGKILHE